MKKFITLVLVLVLALGLTVPAMAFTSDTSEDVDHPYDLKIYLVEYDDNDLFGIAAMPESDRGYAKNEIVAAVIELDVPDGEDPVADGYSALQFRGDNVSFNVTDDPIATTKAAALGTLRAVGTNGEDGWNLTFNDKDGNGTAGGVGDNVVIADDTTYKWLVFAKVTDDEASLTAKLVDGSAGDEFASDTDSITLTLDGTTYTVAKDYSSTDGGDYTITWVDGTHHYGIIIDIDEDYKSTGMSIDLDTATTGSLALGVNTKNELGIVKGAVVDTDGDDYDDVMDIYSDVVVDVFGMDYFLIGNYVRDSFFEDLVSADTIVATVDIEPWTAYVTVPDNIVVDPPKTGDAASIMGFVMVALSGAGVVALRKRG